MRQTQETFIILDAKAATGIGTPMLVEDFRHLVLSFATASSANLTVKIQGSIQHDMPDFSAARTVANMWDYVLIKDLEDATSIDGDTGISVAGTDDFRQFEINTNGLRWICAEVTARSAGSVTVKAKPFNN